MARRCGRSPRGRPCRAAVPHGHWKTSTFIAGLQAGGIVAPLVFDDAMHAEIFRYYVGEMLVPTLVPGDVIVMDNLPAHNGTAIRALIEARDATLLCVPPYSPDLNPIELMFAKLKHLLRTAAARSIDRLWAVLGDWLRKFTPDECSRCPRHCGYGHSA